MTEEKNPEVLAGEVELIENEETAPSVNYSEKSLAELADLFMELARNPDRMKMNKQGGGGYQVRILQESDERKGRCRNRSS